MNNSKMGLRLFFYSGLISLFSIALIDVTVSLYASKYISEDVSSVAKTKCALVLGASKTVANGSPNYFFVYRLRAAAQLYKSAKVSYIIVSGDNSRKNYDESTDMKEALVELGVPANRIYLDYAGFRTLDSVVRSKAIFGQEQIVIVSQKFHNERAVCIARAKGIDAIAFNAEDLPASASRLTLLREKLARVKMALDIILDIQPKFYGNSVTIGEPQTI